MTPDALLQTIHNLRRRAIAGDDAASADLYGFRMQLLRQRERVVRSWRVCTECGLRRPTTAYRLRGHVCQVCRDVRHRALMQQRYQREKAEYRERAAQWLAANYARHLENKRIWWQRNREQINAARREKRRRGPAATG